MKEFTYTHPKYKYFRTEYNDNGEVISIVELDDTCPSCKCNKTNSVNNSNNMKSCKKEPGESNF
jgi:hypothetical protein